ncbi:hypothetical protein FQN54_000788 [Arachnomyces sp. PD_36]|nr:hypothetical protein FQN54_000788 [Arachnomyces sp. PD_36]
MEAPTAAEDVVASNSCPSTTLKTLLSVNATISSKHQRPELPRESPLHSVSQMSTNKTILKAKIEINCNDPCVPTSEVSPGQYTSIPKSKLKVKLEGGDQTQTLKVKFSITDQKDILDSDVAEKDSVSLHEMATPHNAHELETGVEAETVNNTRWGGELGGTPIVKLPAANEITSSIVSSNSEVAQALEAEPADAAKLSTSTAEVVDAACEPSATMDRPFSGEYTSPSLEPESESKPEEVDTMVDEPSTNEPELNVHGNDGTNVGGADVHIVTSSLPGQVPVEEVIACKTSETLPVDCVLISDTHSRHQDLISSTWGDIIIHAGDITAHGTIQEIEDFFNWFSNLPQTYKICVAGNHDHSLEPGHIYRSALSNGQKTDWAMKFAESVSETERLVTWIDSLREKGVIYLRPEEPSTTLTIRGKKIKVYGTPYTPLAFGPNAFMRERGDLMALWNDIIETGGVIDLWISHSPPRDICDMTNRGKAIGCDGLSAMIENLKPSLVVCGHVHDARGVQRIWWGAEGRETVVVNAANMSPGGVMRQEIRAQI